MEVISASVDCVNPKLQSSGIVSLDSDFLAPMDFGTQSKGILIFLRDYSGNFSCSEKRVHRLKEIL